MCYNEKYQQTTTITKLAVEKMKVKDLIEKLSSLDPEAEVSFASILDVGNDEDDRPTFNWALPPEDHHEEEEEDVITVFLPEE